MNIGNRLKRIENQIVKNENVSQIVWDFSKTTNEQLSKLVQILEQENEVEAAKYTKELIDEGFLSYRNSKEK